MKRFAYPLAFCLCVAGELRGQTPFFEGKTIRIFVVLPAGDFYVNYAPLLATYMGTIFLAIPTLLAEAKKKLLKIDPTMGEELVALANEVMSAI